LASCGNLRVEAVLDIDWTGYFIGQEVIDWLGYTIEEEVEALQ
jgi:hypothetical protein